MFNNLPGMGMELAAALFKRRKKQEEQEQVANSPAGRGSDMIATAGRNLFFTPEFTARLKDNNTEVHQDTSQQPQMNSGGKLQGAMGHYSPGDLDVVAGGHNGDTQGTLLHEGLHDAWQWAPEDAQGNSQERNMKMEAIQKALEMERAKGQRMTVAEDSDDGIPRPTNISSIPNHANNLLRGSHVGYYGEQMPDKNADVRGLPKTLQNELFAELPNMYLNSNQEMPEDLRQMYAPYFDFASAKKRRGIADEIQHMLGRTLRY